MANVQKSVSIYPAGAVKGDRASQNDVIYMPYNCIADGNITVGSFVWTSDEVGAPFNAVENSGSGMPLGFVEREMVQVLLPMSADTMVVQDGMSLPVAVRGDFYIVADATANVGDIVYAKTATGAPTLSSASAVDTGFRVMTPGANGDLIVISSWGLSMVTEALRTDLSNIAATAALPIANGGTGVSAIGTAGQVLATNTAATGTEWKTV